ncbi:MAG: hypothetical protein LBP31_03570 [Holosporales bacterium]|nr:hypothetical protein [Holosporales bacterium]
MSNILHASSIPEGREKFLQGTPITVFVPVCEEWRKFLQGAPVPEFIPYLPIHTLETRWIQYLYGAPVPEFVPNQRIVIENMPTNNQNSSVLSSIDTSLQTQFEQDNPSNVPTPVFSPKTPKPPKNRSLSIDNSYLCSKK